MVTGRMRWSGGTNVNSEVDKGEVSKQEEIVYEVEGKKSGDQAPLSHLNARDFRRMLESRHMRGM